MATPTQSQNLDRRETAGLIGSDKVEGTPVYRSDGDRIGQIERIMLDKISRKVAYAVISFGGFLGIGMLGRLGRESAQSSSASPPRQIPTLVERAC
jgi:hypothetical protein